METKICKECGIEKSIYDFDFKNKSQNKISSRCKECLHKRARELYHTRYKERYKERLQKNKLKHRQFIKAEILKLKQSGCIFCGEKDPCCLDFHHIKDKQFGIARKPDITLKDLIKETSKCIVVCSNCHRKIHAKKLKVLNKQQNMDIKFKKLSENAVLPIRAYKGDAGMDLTCTGITTQLNEAGQLMLVYHTGLAVEIPEGYVGLLFPRSSVWKKSLRSTNCVGVIDSGYRGEIMCIYHSTTDVVPAIYKEGERFCQLIIIKLPEYNIVEAEELSESDRGNGGFGSSDKNIKESSAVVESESNDTAVEANDEDSAKDSDDAGQAADLANGSEVAE